MLYKGEYTREISFPLGGIGSGCIGIDGAGRFLDWEIFNKPKKGSRNRFSHFAVRAKTNRGTVSKVLSGDAQKELMGPFRAGGGGYGLGADAHTMCGFPHFRDVAFCGEFPIATLTYADDAFPGKITMTAFNPFIPLDDRNSSIPAAFFEITLENTACEDVEYRVALSLASVFSDSENLSVSEDGFSAIHIRDRKKSVDAIDYGDMTIAASGGDVFCQNYWYRGAWMDAIVTYWNEFSSDDGLRTRNYTDSRDRVEDTSTICVSTKVASGQRKSVRFCLAWNFPNCQNDWTRDGDRTPWKNYYATLFADSLETARYSLKNWDMLYGRTLDFKQRLYKTSIDPVFIEAISATLSVLKSPTVLRLEDGSFYGWEGVNTSIGSCEGTCQHVWNYAYALCFLFPSLERSIRDLEYRYSLDENGKMVFRMGLPLGKNQSSFRACLDGQMGCILKTYREWKLSGDDEWLLSHKEEIKRCFSYVWSENNPDEWDRDRDGVLEGRQHHTLDMELFGPSSWLEGMYLAALKAMAELSRFFGEDPAPYEALFEKGYRWSKENLFNGSYFIQKIDLCDKAIVEHFRATDAYWNEETGEIKYQIGDGSEIDQMLGQWHADILGLGEIFERDQVDVTLSSMMKYNYKESMRDFVNPWRVFSLNDEAGTVMCDYPSGTYKPRIPVPYCEETMHGFEYQFAGLLASRGRIEEAKQVVKAIRDKYDGKKRNPWNEMECGSNYARSMASFALLPILSGFEFDLPRNYIGFSPKIVSDTMNYFWSVGTGYGSFVRDDDRIVVEIAQGYLTLNALGLDFLREVRSVKLDGKEVPFRCENGKILFQKQTARCAIEIN